MCVCVCVYMYIYIYIYYYYYYYYYFIVRYNLSVKYLLRATGESPFNSGVRGVRVFAKDGGFFSSALGLKSSSSSQSPSLPMLGEPFVPLTLADGASSARGLKSSSSTVPLDTGQDKMSLWESSSYCISLIKTGHLNEI